MHEDIRFCHSSCSFFSLTLTRLLGLVHQSKLYVRFPTMSMVDNQSARLGQFKKVQADSLLHCCHGSGQFMTPPMAPSQDCKPVFPPSMPSFEPRAFPPPSLTGVPIEYIIGQLHNFATQYWDKPETADCTISMRFHQLFFWQFLTYFKLFLSLTFAQHLNCLHYRQSQFSSLHILSLQAMIIPL